jgi:hypothetical protein
MKPWTHLNAVYGFTTDPETWLWCNNGFTTDPDWFHHRPRRSHHRPRLFFVPHGGVLGEAQ